MNTFLATLLVGVSLSMDAFSLALIYGTQGINNKNKILLSLIVGVYHFFMPLIGLFFGNIITNFLNFNISIFVSVIFFIIGIEMIISSIKKKEEKLLLTVYGFFAFGLSVSIDSFTTGIGFKAITNSYFEVAIVFCLVSGMFTFLGLFLGNKLKSYFGKISTLLGGFILIVLGIYYFFS